MEHKRTRILVIAAAAAMLGCGAMSALSEPALFTNVTMDEIVVTARKYPEPVQEVPGSITVRTDRGYGRTGLTDLRSAGDGVPNLTMATFATRRLAFPYIRGIGSGQNAPAVAIYIDGVPQLTYLTANQDLLGVERVEFIRGPQGALYGRDSLGGVIAFVPRLPADELSASAEITAGSHNLREGRFILETPLGASDALFGLGGGYAARDGFTENMVTGRDIDSREAALGRAQLFFPDQGNWDFRLSLTAQRDRDGGYALYDLDSIRETPRRAAHDWEGYNRRDLAQPVLTLRRHGDLSDFMSVTAWQWWQTRDRTDLDYTPADILRKDTARDGRAWIQEWRLTSPAGESLNLGDRLDLRWLAGLFAFHERYMRRDMTDYRPGGVEMGLWPAPFETQQESDEKSIGASLFGHTTLVIDGRWDIGLGLRHDYQRRESEAAARITPDQGYGMSGQSRDFNQVSPSASLGFRPAPSVFIYTDIAKGYRAGGFNAISPPDHSTFDEETSINYEAGAKTMWLERRLTVNGTLFHTMWDDIQVNSPVPGGSPADYFVENGGAAWSQGAELEVNAKLLHGLTLFTGLGLLDTGFRSGSVSAGRPVDGNRLPFAPSFTWHAGVDAEMPLGSLRRGFARAEITGASRYYYDAWNAEAQSGHALVNLRIGMETGPWRIEGWVRNLFDRETVPLAIPYGADAAGRPTYIGESGPPCTAGISLARAF